jgi:hypothetical protein
MPHKTLFLPAIGSEARNRFIARFRSLRRAYPKNHYDSAAAFG